MWGGKVEAEQCEQLRISKVMRRLPFGSKLAESAFSWNSGLRVDFKVNVSEYELDGLPQILVWYSIEEDGEKKELCYSIYFTETPCNLGGKRYWFKCPLGKDGRRCSRRVAVLYFTGKYFGCRHCLDLTYQSQNLNYSGRFRYLDLQFRAQDLQEKMKRYTWGGKDTRQMRQLRKIYTMLGYPHYADALIRLRARKKAIAAQ